MVCRRGFHLARHAAEAVHQKLLQVPSRAIGAEKAEVVNMERPARMRFAHLLRVNLVQPVLLGERFAHIIVHAVDGFLRVGVFLDLPVLIVQVIGKHVDRRADQGVGFPCRAAFFTIEDIGLRGLGVPAFNEDLFHEVLYFLHVGGVRL